MRRWGRAYVNAFQSSVALPKSSSRFYIFYLSLILGRPWRKLYVFQLHDRHSDVSHRCTYSHVWLYQCWEAKLNILDWGGYHKSQLSVQPWTVYWESIAIYFGLIQRLLSNSWWGRANPDKESTTQFIRQVVSVYVYLIKGELRIALFQCQPLSRSKFI